MPNKQIFLENICYTPLVFGRFNKKLGLNLSELEIKQLVNQIISADNTIFQKEGKNYYLQYEKIELVINFFNYRLITANRI